MEFANLAGSSSVITLAHLGVPARHETQPPKNRGSVRKCTEYVKRKYHKYNHSPDQKHRNTYRNITGIIESKSKTDIPSLTDRIIAQSWGTDVTDTIIIRDRGTGWNRLSRGPDQITRSITYINVI